ncbi:MAG: hypothetical protein IJT27_09275 [Clostridia bacterium]|nr:hypothetical protein [Clostridia bacterium]
MNKEILADVVACAKKVLDCPEFDDPAYYDTPLTGTPFQFSAIDMVYLFLEIRDKFQVRFFAEDVENYGFITINKITGIIERKE